MQWLDHVKLQKLCNYNPLVAAIILHILCSVDMTFGRYKGVSFVFDS